MNRPHIPVFLLLLWAMAGTPIMAEVTIVRRLPESGSNQAEADWKRPMIPEERPTVEDPAAARLSGRLIVGGSGSGTGDTATIEDWSTDSQLNYKNYIGEKGLLDIRAQAFRDKGIDTFNQRYSGGLAYSSPDFTFNLSGNFDQRESLAVERQSETTSGAMG